jgi:hypothetical protein
VIIQGNQTQSFISADQRDLGNGDSAISEFPKTRRAARSVHSPSGQGGRTQFDLEIMWQLSQY